jgi:hypothetical protein
VGFFSVFISGGELSCLFGFSLLITGLSLIILGSFSIVGKFSVVGFSGGSFSP